MARETPRGKIQIDKERCKGCELCMHVCPSEGIEMDPELNKKGYSPARSRESEKECTGCAQCATVCPEVAIEVYRAK